MFTFSFRYQYIVILSHVFPWNKTFYHETRQRHSRVVRVELIVSWSNATISINLLLFPHTPPSTSPPPLSACPAVAGLVPGLQANLVETEKNQTWVFQIVREHSIIMQCWSPRVPMLRPSQHFLNIIVAISYGGRWAPGHLSANSLTTKTMNIIKVGTKFNALILILTQTVNPNIYWCVDTHFRHVSYVLYELLMRKCVWCLGSFPGLWSICLPMSLCPRRILASCAGQGIMFCWLNPNELQKVMR